MIFKSRIQSAAILLVGSDRAKGQGGQLPCNVGGGSPLLFTDYSRVTGSVLIWLHYPSYCYCGMASAKPMSNSWGVQRRVDRSSTESSTKAYDFTLPEPLILASLPPIFSLVSTLLRRSYFSSATRSGGLICV